MFKDRKKKKLLKGNKYSVKGQNQKNLICHREFTLSQNNRLTYTYKVSKNKEIIEVTSVSLEIRINDHWETIIHYDSFHHGNLHRHTKVAVGVDQDIIDSNNVKKRGTQKDLLEWSINDLKNHYVYYKKSFLKRNSELLKGKEVEFY